MARTIDLRLSGVTFEDAVKRMIATPPPSKKAKQSKAANAKRRSKRTP